MKHPSTIVDASGALVEAPKASSLTRDASLPLCEGALEAFRAGLHAACAGRGRPAFLSEAQCRTLANIMSADREFPFTARFEEGRLVLTPHIKSQPAVLKDISNGVTSVCASMVCQASLGEAQKFRLAMLFQSPILAAYAAAGVEEGPHTKYTFRSC